MVETQTTYQIVVLNDNINHVSQENFRRSTQMTARNCAKTSNSTLRVISIVKVVARKPVSVVNSL